MGGNGSYKGKHHGVPKHLRSHTDTHKHIDGHKILLQSLAPKASKNIMYSNSESPIYLIAKLKKGNVISVQKLNIFEGNKLKYEVNLRFDKSGNLLGYNPKNHDAGSHAHIWHETKAGHMDRVVGANGKEIHMAIPTEYHALINKIVQFNNRRVQYNG